LETCSSQQHQRGVRLRAKEGQGGVPGEHGAQRISLRHASKMLLFNYYVNAVLCLKIGTVLMFLVKRFLFFII